MRLRSLGVLFSAAIILGLIAYWPYKNSREIEEEIKYRTVRINILDTQDRIYGCTGTLLSHNYVLTNAHCFPTPTGKPFIRRYNDNEFTSAVVVSSATKTDYALLQFKGKDMSEQVVFTDKWHLGEDIILYGNLGARDFVVGHSRIVSYVYVYTPLHKLRTMILYPCNEAAPGFSGSGIYNLRGEYLGTHELGQEIPIFAQILTRLAGEPRQGPLCFAIPAKEAMDRNLDRPWFGYNMEDK